MNEIADLFPEIIAAVAGLALGRGWGALDWRGHRRNRRKTSGVWVTVLKKSIMEKSKDHAKRSKYHALITDATVVRPTSVRTEGKAAFGRNGSCLEVGIVCDNQPSDVQLTLLKSQVAAWERAYDTKLPIRWAVAAGKVKAAYGV